MTERSTLAQSSWFDDATQLPNLEQKVEELESFTTAMADGTIDKTELEAQAKRLVAAVEPDLDEALHAKVTTLLVELTAYDIMRTLHELQAEKLRSRFK